MIEPFSSMDDRELLNIAGIADPAALSSFWSDKQVLLLGIGDLMLKKLPWVRLMHLLGIKVFAADLNPNPSGRDALAPFIENYIVLDGGKGDRELVRLAKRNPYSLIDISTWGDSHMAMAMRFQDIAGLLVGTKPVDTNLELLANINRYHSQGSPLFRQLVENLRIHDHYGSRWVVLEAARRMPGWQAEEGFIREIQIFILESQSVADEHQRLDALKDGICLDLLPHVFRVLQALLPIGAAWENGKITYTRRSLRLKISGGARENNIGTPIAGEIETFAAVSLQGTETVEMTGGLHRTEHFPFRLLCVVGKGVEATPGNQRDTKGLAIKFQTGARVTIDLDSQRIRTPHGDIVAPPTVLHRGINLPLLEVIKAGEDGAPGTEHHFQPFGDAFQAAMLIDQARRLPWMGRAYPKGAVCSDLVNTIPRDWWGAVQWQLANIDLYIGTVPPKTIVVP